MQVNHFGPFLLTCLLVGKSNSTLANRTVFWGFMVTTRIIFRGGGGGEPQKEPANLNLTHQIKFFKNTFSF
jgi:hypothetical protein